MLKGGKAVLKDKARRPITEISFSNFSTKVAVRPNDCIGINLLLETLRVSDYASVPGQRLDLLAPDVAKIATLSEGAGIPPALLIVAVDVKPLDNPNADLKIAVDSQPVLVNLSRVGVGSAIFLLFVFRSFVNRSNY